MTKERLNHLIKTCKRRPADDGVFYREIAGHLGVAPITLRRWVSGDRPVPRLVELVMEIYHFWPTVTAEAVDKLIQARDEGTKA